MPTEDETPSPPDPKDWLKFTFPLGTAKPEQLHVLIGKLSMELAVLRVEHERLRAEVLTILDQITGNHK